MDKIIPRILHKVLCLEVDLDRILLNSHSKVEGYPSLEGRTRLHKIPEGVCSVRIKIKTNKLNKAEVYSATPAGQLK